MARAKIAPTLSYAVTLPEAASTRKLAERELRALLAVARAAEREGQPFADGDVPACPCGTCRAYARLARASRGEK